VGLAVLPVNRERLSVTFHIQKLSLTLKNQFHFEKINFLFFLLLVLLFLTEENCLTRKKVTKDAGWQKIEEFGRVPKQITKIALLFV